MDFSINSDPSMRRKSSRRIFGILSILLVIGVVSLSCETQGLETVEISINDTVFVVEIARTVEEQRLGLMFRRSMDEDRGMLFVYEADRRLDFWMKDTYIPLSIAYLTSQGEIVEIFDMTPESQRSVPSSRSVRYALELNQGAFDRIDAKPGTFVELPDGWQ